MNDGSGHSNQVENRLTRLEVAKEDQTAVNGRTRTRLIWHERALRLLAAVVYMLASGKAHDYAPMIAELLLKLIRMTP